MRTLGPLCLPLFVAACAAGPATPPTIDPASLVPVRSPARDPYAFVPGPEWEPPVRIHAPRVTGWTPARHRVEVAAISSLLSVAIDPVTDTSLITGPAAAADAAATLLSDRARHEAARLRLYVHEARWPADAWSFEALSRCEGGLWAVVPASAARAMAEAAGAGFGVLQVADGEEVEHADLRQFGLIAEVDVEGVLHGELLLDPVEDTVTLGLEARATVRLAGLGDRLVLDWSCLRATGSPEHATLSVGNARGYTAVPVGLPRVQRTSLSGRFVLRHDEALLLVQTPPDGAEGVLITLVGWELERRVP
jgi:hypothetical protein